MYKKFYLKSLLLLLALIVGNGSVWADTYEIIFKSATSDSNTDLGANPSVTDVVDTGTGYVASFSNCKKMYVGVQGIKLGSSSATGSMNFTLESNYQQNIKSITVVSAKYGSDSGMLTLYSGTTLLSYSITPGIDYTHTFNTPTTVTSLKLNTTSKRAYITKIILTTEDGGTTPSLSVNPSSIAFGDNAINGSYEESFSVSFANLTQDLSVSVGSGLTDVTVSPATISHDAASPQTVTVTYAPTVAGNISGDITINNTTDEVSQTVAVTGSAYDPANVDTYEPFTGALVEGDYIIYGNSGAMQNTLNNGPRFNNEAVTVTDDAITNPSASIIWHIAPNGDYWTMYNAAVGKYAGGTTSKNQGALLDEVTDHAKWKIYYQDSNWTIENYGRSQGSDPNNKYLRQNSTNGWATYGSGTGSAPTLYKKVVTNQVASPAFNPAAGTYTSAQSVTISTETEGATIYYTTDGTAPTTESTEYTTAVTVDQTMTIKAIAVKDDMNDSEVASASYTILGHAGTAADPFTVADAIAATPTTNNVYISGIVSSFYNTSIVGDEDNYRYYISDDGTTTTQLLVYKGKGLNQATFTNAEDLLVGDEVVIYGRLTTYNNASEVASGNYIVSLNRPVSTDPVINADANVTLEHDATSGVIAYTITNPSENVSLTATTDADWISNIAVGETSVTFTTTANEGNEDRSATFTLSYTGAQDKTVTVTQGHYVVDYATLPFTFNSGISAIANTAGLTQSGLGSDYANAPLLKFDSTGDYIILKIDETPGTLTFDIKGNGFSGGTFKVQTSADGSTYSDLATYTEFETNTQSESFDNLSANVRYIKWVYTEKASGNVGLGNISLTAYTPTVKYYLAGSWGENDYGWGEGMEQLTNNGDGSYSINKNLANGTTFKIVKVDETATPTTTTWYGGGTNDDTYGIHSGWYKNISLVAGNDGKDFKIEGTCDDHFTFTVDTTNMKLTVTGWHVPVTKYYLAGSWTDGWSLSGMVELTEHDGLYTGSKNFEGNTLFKFVKTVDGNITEWYGPTSSGNYGVHSGHCTDIALSTNSGDSNFIIEPQGSYSFSLDIEGMKFSVSGWPITADGNMFVKVTSGEDFTDGAYLIVYEDGNLAFDGSLTTSTSTALSGSGNHIAVDIVNNAIVADATTKASLFYIQGNTIKSASGYYIGRTSDSNGMDVDDETVYTNTISIDNDNNVVIKSSGNAYLRYNTSGNGMFRYYKSGTYTQQKDIQLYKLVTLPAVTFSENAEDNSVIAANELLVVNATLERTLSNTYWSTFSVPFDVDAAQVAEVLGENVGLREFDGSEGTVIKFKATTAITAGHAYLVKPETAVTNPVFNGVTVVNTTGIPDSDDRGYGFVGAVIKKTLKTDQTELFLGTDAKFYYPEADKATMKGLRGYFVVPEGTETSKLSVDVEGSGIATSINSMNIEGMGDGNIYNLNGQRVNAPQKGLYIVNGKKVIIK